MVVRPLLEQDGINVNLKDLDSRSALSYAAENGHEVIVHNLLARDDVEVDLRNVYGRSPLSFAAEKGHDIVVKLLLGWNSINVDLMDSMSRTAEKRREAVVSQFAARDDVDVYSHDLYDRTPLIYAASNHHKVVAELLTTRDGIKRNPSSLPVYCSMSLLYAAKVGYGAIVRLLLLWDDVEVNSKESLSYAAESGHEVVVEMLLVRDDIEVDPNDNCGRTPLSFATEKGHMAVAKQLVAQNKTKPR